MHLYTNVNLYISFDICGAIQTDTYVRHTEIVYLFVTTYCIPMSLMLNSIEINYLPIKNMSHAAQSMCLGCVVVPISV